MSQGNAPNSDASHDEALSRRSALKRLAWAVPTVTALQLYGNQVLASASAPSGTTPAPPPPDDPGTTTTPAPIFTSTTAAPTTPAPTTTEDDDDSGGGGGGGGGITIGGPRS